MDYQILCVSNVHCASVSILISRPSPLLPSPPSQSVTGGSHSTTTHPFTPAHDTYSTHANNRANSSIPRPCQRCSVQAGPKLMAAVPGVVITPPPQERDSRAGGNPGGIEGGWISGDHQRGITSWSKLHSGVDDQRRLVHHARGRRCQR